MCFNNYGLINTLPKYNLRYNTRDLVNALAKGASDKKYTENNILGGQDCIELNFSLPNFIFALQPFPQVFPVGISLILHNTHFFL